MSDTNTTGTDGSQQLPPQGAADQQQLAGNPGQQNPNTGTESVQPNPELLALQAQLAEVQQARQLAEHQAREHQAAFTRSQQALKALTGNDPSARPPDPLAPHLKFYTDQGINLEDAKLFAQRDHLQEQRIQQLESRMQLNQVPNIMQQAGMTRPDLFTDPQVYQQVQKELANQASLGQAPDVDAAIGIALVAKDFITYQAMQKQNGQQQQRQFVPPGFNSFHGAGAQPFTGMQPAQQQKPVPTQQQQQWAADFAAMQPPKK